MRKLEGIYPILNTTFHDDGTIDLESQARLTEFLLEQGAHGLGLFGNASEGYALLTEERRAILKTVRNVVKGSVPLVVSSGANGSDAAVALSKEVEDEGADALMVLPPFYLKTDADGLMHYFEAISNAVKIPIMVQDAPLMTQVPMPASLLARMANEIERVRYAKVEAPPTAPKVSAVLKSGGPVVFGGLNGQFMIEEIDRGARGMMPGSDMIGLFVDIWNRLESGDRTGAWQVFTRALPLIRFELQPGMGVSAMKHNLLAAGLIRSARVRHPTVSLDENSLRELKFLREWVAADQPAAARA
ncbi:MAG TPA: dihydrodipicolinate synthase family protein [Bryobacteraceae bacterium]|nr:dihydrodipicolinate synthase family protein [Bryobacteraceae bacterium]